MRAKTGGNMFMYRSTGTAAAPVWVLVASVEDVAISELVRKLAEMRMRSSQFTKNLPALIDTISVDFKHWYGVDSTNFNAMQSLFFNGIVEEWAIMDDVITVTGSQGLRCAMILAQFNINEQIEDAANVDVGLRTAYWESPPGTVIEPSWFTVAGGSSTTTTTVP